MFEKECKSRYGTLAAISVILTVLLYTVSAMSVISNINRYIQILSGLGMGSLFSKENDFTFGADEEEPFDFGDDEEPFDFGEDESTFFFEDNTDESFGGMGDPVTPAQTQVSTGNSDLDTIYNFYYDASSYSYCDINSLEFAEDAYDPKWETYTVTGYSIGLYEDMIGLLDEEAVKPTALEMQPAVITIVNYTDWTDFVFDMNWDKCFRVMKDGTLLEGMYPAYPGCYEGEGQFYTPRNDVHWDEAQAMLQSSSTDDDGIATDNLAANMLTLSSLKNLLMWYNPEVDDVLVENVLADINTHAPTADSFEFTYKSGNNICSIVRIDVDGTRVDMGTIDLFGTNGIDMNADYTDPTTSAFSEEEVVE